MNPMKFANEAWIELKKSTWLTRPQATGSTMVVVVLVCVVAVYISSIDFVLSIVMGSILSH